MRSVWVLGPSRSGTSMTAGLFAAHGVFFGECHPADKDNPKGYWENRYLKSTVGRQVVPSSWPHVWYSRLLDEGWDGIAPWGAKGGVEWWRVVKATNPTAVVICYRPVDAILESRSKHSWMQPTRSVPEIAYRSAERILSDAETAGRVHRVDTDRVACGDVEQLLPVFSALDLRYSERITMDWIDPQLWNGGRR